MESVCRTETAKKIASTRPCFHIPRYLSPVDFRALSESGASVLSFVSLVVDLSSVAFPYFFEGRGRIWFVFEISFSLKMFLAIVVQCMLEI